MALLGAPLVLVTLAGNGWMRGVQDTVRPLRFVLAGNGLSALVCPLLVHGLGGLGRAGPGRLGRGQRGRPDGGRGAVPRGAGPGAARAGAVPLRPRPAMLRAQLGLGRDLLARSLAFQACFLSAAAVATRFGRRAAAAHQIVLQLWFFQALVLDAVAIAAQSLVGAALGASGTTAGAAGPGAGPRR